MYSRRQFIQFGSAAIGGLALPQWVAAKNELPGKWRSLASMPFGVQEIYPAIHNGNIHVAGGFAVSDGAAAPTDKHLQYSIKTDSWLTLAPLPNVRHHVHLVVCEGGLYALGGFGVSGSNQWVMHSQSWKYDAVNDAWLVVPKAPQVHAESVAVAMGQGIHIVGGRRPKGERNSSWLDHIDNTRHMIYDVASMAWLEAAPAINPRNSAAGAIINDLLYIAGGRSVSGGNLDFLEVYDFKEDRWRLATPMPQAQAGLAAAAINGELVAFGGEYFGGGGVGVHSNTWSYNPARDRWVERAAMKTPRHGLGAVSDGESIFAMGGATGVATRGTSSMLERYSL